MCFLTVNEHVTGNGDEIHKGTYCVGFLTVNENMREWRNEKVTATFKMKRNL